MGDFTHFNEQGRAKMVDVGEKPVTTRTAVAAARVLVSRENRIAHFYPPFWKYTVFYHAVFIKMFLFSLK